MALLHRLVMVVVLGGAMAAAVHDAGATIADRLYGMALFGGMDRGSGWYGLELGVENDHYSPHDIVGGVLGLVPGPSEDSDSELVRGVAGVGGFFLGYRLRPKWPGSPFVGVSAINSFPTVDESYLTLNPEAGFSVPVRGPYSAELCIRYGFSTDGRSGDIWTCGIGISYRGR